MVNYVQSVIDVNWVVTETLVIPWMAQLIYIVPRPTNSAHNFAPCKSDGKGPKVVSRHTTQANRTTSERNT